MRVWVLIGVALLGVAAWTAGVRAQGFAHTYSLASGTVTVSNSQENSSWVAVSVMIQYAAPSSGAVEIRRWSQGRSYLLEACSFTNVTTLVWVPDAAYPFGYGEALVIGSSVTNGVVQVTRRGD